MRKKKKNILVIDDDLDVLEVLKEGLTSDRYQVHTAESGREALKILKEEKIQLVILDLMMPAMDGYEVLKRMKPQLKRKIPVIILTVKDKQKDFIEAFKFDIRFYITKPFRLEKLRRAASYYLEELSSSEKTEIEDTI